MVKLDLEKVEEPEIKLPTSVGSSKNQERSRKTSSSVLLTTPKPLTVWITTNCGKFLKRWEYQTMWPASWETYMQVKTQQLKLDMEQQTGSKSGKEYVKAVYCHPAYLIYMQSSVQFSHSVVSDSATPWTAACQVSLFITNSQSLLKLMSFESVMPTRSNHLILCRPLLLLLLPSVFPSIRVFSKESVLHITWPKDWSRVCRLISDSSVMPPHFHFGNHAFVCYFTKSVSASQISSWVLLFHLYFHI